MVKSPKNWWASLPLLRKGFVVVFIPLLVVIVDCASLFSLVRAEDRAEEAAAASARAHSVTDEILTNFHDAEAGVRGFLLSGSEEFLAAHQELRDELPVSLAHLREIASTATLRRRLPGIETHSRRELELLDELRASSGPGFGRNAALTAGKATMDELTDQLEEVHEAEEALVEQLTKEADTHRGRAAMVLGLSLPVALGGGLWAMALFSTGVARRVRRVQENAQRLQQGIALLPAAGGQDEIGELERAFERAAELIVRREEELSGARDEADRANRYKSEFLSRMSHELRTPLNAILGFGQLLEIDDLSREQSEAVDQILRGGRHLLGLINEVLDISRIETGTLALSPELVLLSDAIRETVDLMRPLAATADVELVTPSEKECDRQVLADHGRLTQVMLNLASNAVKYNRPGGHVIFSCDSTGTGRVRVTVQDDGVGIPADKMERLFVPFDRLGAEGTEVEGTGIGLALSRGLVQAMGGSLTATSEPGAGSAFVVELPEAISRPVTARQEKPSPFAHPGPAVDKTVVYVEDNPSNVRLVERVLERFGGVELLTTASGSQALEIIEQRRPDLVLLDLHLPDMSGEKVLGRIDATVPVVVISADATAGRREHVLASGAYAYLAKPLDLRELQEVIEPLLRPLVP